MCPTTQGPEENTAEGLGGESQSAHQPLGASTTRCINRLVHKSVAPSNHRFNYARSFEGALGPSLLRACLPFGGGRVVDPYKGQPFGGRDRHPVVSTWLCH